MNIIYKVAKTELKNLFYSPIAWFLIIAFLITNAMVYMDGVDNNVQAQELGGTGLEYMKDLTSRIFSERTGLLGTVMKNLYLFMPLLTMGLISREINGGTIKLLYSSPVKISDIVLGKYLSMLIYSLILVAIVSVFMLIGFLHVVELDSGMLVASVLSLYLLLATYGAIGLFMSSLSTYQVVAAISTFLTIGALSYVGELWQDVDFIRDLTYFLSLTGRSSTMIKGLLSTKHIIYFLVIIYIFISFTIIKLKSGTDAKPFWVQTFRYFAVLFSALAIGYLTSRPFLTGYLDMSQDQKMTLTPNAQNIINELDGDQLEVTLYSNLMDNFNWIGFPGQRNYYLGIWEPYTRFKTDITFKYVNYYDNAIGNAMLADQYKGKSLKEMAEMHAKNFRVNLDNYLSPAEIHKIIDLVPEGNRLVMQLKYKDKKVFLRVFDDQMMFPGETEFSAAFKRLKSTELPKIVYLKGNLERDINKDTERDYQMLTNTATYRHSLINQGFDMDTISLETQDIDKSTTVLVIADPKKALSATVLSKIKAYIAQGRNLIIAGEPGKQDILNPILKQLNVQLLPGSIVQPDEKLSQNISQNYISDFAAAFSKELAKQQFNNVIVTMPSATAIAYEEQGPFKVTPLLFTNGKKSWLKKNNYVLDSVDVTFSATDGDIQQSFPTAIALTRSINGKEQRIIVAGDADFMSSGELKRYNVRKSNFTFNTAIYSWLSYGEFPIDTSRPEAKDKRMKISSEQVKIYRVILVWILPAFVLAFATIFLVRRKRK